MNNITFGQGISAAHRQLRRLARAASRTVSPALFLDEEKTEGNAMEEDAETSSTAFLLRRLNATSSMTTLQNALGEWSLSLAASPLYASAQGQVTAFATQSQDVYGARAASQLSQGAASSALSACAPDGGAQACEGSPDFSAPLDGETLGHLVASTVNREIGRMARARRYTG